MCSVVSNKQHLRELLIHFINMKKNAAECHRKLTEKMFYPIHNVKDDFKDFEVVILM